jgi:hypothetical protein
LELAVHKQTLQDLIDARDGKTPNVQDGFSSWDLANPYSSQYEAMTGRQQTAFTDVINNIATDASIVKDLERGFVQSATMGLDGKWHLGPAVNPASGEASGMTTMINVNGKYVMAAVAGSIIQAPNAQDPTKLDDIGYFFDLGNGDFRVVVDGKTYAKNYNPFTGTTSTADDFRAAYVPRTNIVTPYNIPQSSSGATFVVPSSDLAAVTDQGLGSSNPMDAVFESLRSRLDKIQMGDGMTPDSFDRMRDSIINDARQSVVGTEWESQFDSLFPTSAPTTTTPGGSGRVPGVPNFNGGPGMSKPYPVQGPSFTPMSQSDFNTFRAGERDMTTTTPSFSGEGFLNYTFRNTPISTSSKTSSLFKSTPLSGLSTTSKTMIPL